MSLIILHHISMPNNRKTDKQQDFLVKFTCAVTYEGWISIDGTRETIARLTHKKLSNMDPHDIRQWATHGIGKKITVGKAIKGSSVRATLVKVPRDIESPYTGQ